MDKIYSEIWQLAEPYYLKGRPADIEHIKWLMETIEVKFIDESVDISILFPLSILHDIGYALCPDPAKNPFGIDMRNEHMKQGAVLAKKILDQVKYPKDKADQIIYYISVHDVWALGNNDIYKNDKVLGSFTDLDFIWMASPLGFPNMQKILGKEPTQLYDFLATNEKLVNRPFCTETTKNLFQTLMMDRKKEHGLK